MTCDISEVIISGFVGVAVGIMILALALVVVPGLAGLMHAPLHAQVIPIFINNFSRMSSTQN